MDISPRLKAIAQLVPVGATLADIGTDHGYLPVYLMKKGIIKHAVAGDIGEGPLLSARDNIIFHGLKERIETRLGDGLQVLQPGEIEVVTMAGMGGGTMVKIFEGSPAVVKQLKMLILQPMTDANLVRKYLVNHGWRFLAEELVMDDNRLYEVMALVPGEEKDFGELIYEIGPLLLEKGHPLLRIHIEKLIEARERILTNLQKSSRQEANEKGQKLQEEVNQLKVFWEEA